MNFHRFTLLLGLTAAALGARAEPAERERNAWPFMVERTTATGAVESTGAAGPLLFSRPNPDGGVQRGLRPLWVETTSAQGDLRGALFLYPLFAYAADDETYRWSVLTLMNRSGRRAGAPAPGSELETHEGFDVWPFWFFRQTGDPATSHRALFPIAGTLRRRLGYDRLSWALWPLYVESDQKGVITTSTPWPFVRVVHGTASGFALWPLFGWQNRLGGARREFYLWPLGYNHTTPPAADAPAGTPPVREFAALPFYAHASGPGYTGETYFWPFFGYTHRTAPERYHETRYLWPLLVQGRGDDHYLNRWAPLYTRSVAFGYEKTWIAWPLWREVRWTSEGVAQTKSQLLYFVYWSREQRSATNPNLPAASITHLWPLVSVWDNGAGRLQWQFPSPLEVFFPGNEKVRAAWTPLFSLARFDQRQPGNTRTSLLWDAITWEHRDAEQTAEFHLGPLLSITSVAQDQRVAIGHGLLGMRRTAGDRAWRAFLFDFSPKPATKNLSARLP